MSPIAIDLFSDVVTRPTAAMRRAMAEAEVGDEQKREDPTTNRLQDEAAALLGKEAALFLPSGTMCNQIAMCVHLRPGDEVILERTCHIYNFEGGGCAALAGAIANPIEGRRGIFSAEHVDALIRPRTNHHPRSRMVCVEQTTNQGGGAVWPLPALRSIVAAARRHGLVAHMDGARLMNAVVASGHSAAEICEGFDSCWLDLSKGLGAPVGGILAGSRDFITEAWRWKHRLGGAMRQSGVIAAAGLHALAHHVGRLADDHANARALADGLATIAGLSVEGPVETNMVFFDVGGLGIDGARFRELTESRGLRFSPGGARNRIRAVTHLDVTAAQITEAVAIVREVAASRVPVTR